MIRKVVVRCLLVGLLVTVPAFAATVHEVQMTTVDFQPRFIPDNIVVEPGDTVRWINTDPFLIDHATASGTGSTDALAGTIWDSGTLAPGEAFETTFQDLGNFPYFSAPHEYEGMFGVVTVTTSLPAQGGVEASTWGRIKSRFNRFLPKDARE